MEKRILKIKYGSDKKHSFVYEVIKDRDNGIIDEFDFKSKDKALPEFYESLQALAEHACRICEFPREYDKNVTVIGVSFSYTEVEDSEDVMGAVITFRKELEGSNSPLIINTPHKPSEFYDGKGDESPQDPALLLTPECVEALKVLQDEAFRYIDGERDNAQMGLFESKGEQKQAEATSPSPSKGGEQKQESDDDYQGEAFKKVETKKGKVKSDPATQKRGTAKQSATDSGKAKKEVTEIAKEFRKGMQKIADDDNVKITISSPDMPGESAYFSPGG